MSMQACVVRVTIFSTGGKLPVSCVQSYTLLLRCPFFILHLIKLQHTHTQSHTHPGTNNINYFFSGPLTKRVQHQ